MERIIHGMFIIMFINLCGALWFFLTGQTELGFAASGGALVTLLFITSQWSQWLTRQKVAKHEERVEKLLAEIKHAIE